MEDPGHARRFVVEVTGRRREGAVAVAVAGAAKELNGLGGGVEGGEGGGVAATELDLAGGVDGGGGVHGAAGEGGEVVAGVEGGGAVVGEAAEGLGGEAAALEEEAEVEVEGEAVLGDATLEQVVERLEDLPEALGGDLGPTAATARHG